MITSPFCVFFTITTPIPFHSSVHMILHIIRYMEMSK